MTMDMISANAVVKAAFEAGYEEGRKEWPRIIPIDLMPKLDADYLAYGYASPIDYSDPRGIDNQPYWVEATFRSPYDSSDTPHWITKAHNYLFDVTHWLELPPPIP